MKRHTLYRLFMWVAMFTFATCTIVASPAFPDDEDQYDESIRKPVRRLYPNRERDKAMKKYQQEQERAAKKNQKAAEVDDPWADGGQPAAAPSADKAELYELLSKDYSTPTIIVPEYKQPEPFVWRDEKPNVNENQLLKVVEGRRVSEPLPAMRYLPKGSSMANNANDIFLYFDEGAEPERLRLRVQYYADDPLNFNEVQFYVDGFDYVYRPKITRRGKGTGRMIWENSDNSVTDADKDLIYALTHGQWVEMSLVGHDGIKHVKVLSEKQLENLRAVLQMYLLHGGKI